MENNKLLLFCSGIDDILSGTTNVGGIQVQMLFWGKTFSSHGWDVFTFSDNELKVKSEFFVFLKIKPSKWLSRWRLEILQDIRIIFYGFRKCKPNLVMIRGASRGLFFLHFFCKLKGAKLVFLGASDSDFIPNKEIVAGNPLNRKLYQKAVRRTKYFVTQNQEQYTALKNNYQKESLTLANIWLPCEKHNISEKKYDAIWVAYLRPLKRAEWFLDLARRWPQYQFAIAGGVSNQAYYDQIEEAAEEIPNLAFLGAQSFDEINKLMAQSKLLVCTSEFEGFPNTFLQAWSQSVPVVSTVNPSGVITEFKLGTTVIDKDDLFEQVNNLLISNDLYRQYCTSIDAYFLKYHDADNAYKKLIDYLYSKSNKK